MMWLYLAAAAIALCLLFFVGWRYASRVKTLPCPTALAWMLEGGLVDRVMNTPRTISYLSLKPGMRVLEIGPGPGRLLLRAAQQVAPDGEAVGFELQPKMIELLKSRAERAKVVNLRVIQGDAGQPVDGNLTGFDVVLMSTVLGEIPDRTAALRNAYSMLRPGGLLSITEALGDPHYQRMEKVRQLATAAGFVPGPVYSHWIQFTANFKRPAE